MLLVDREDVSDRPATAPITGCVADDLVYVIYTSGSTGRPKGVCLTHANVLRLVSTAQEHYAFDETDIWPLFHSFAFDVSVWEMWGALLHGGRLVVVPDALVRSPSGLLDLLVEHQVTVLNQTPSAFRGLVELAAAGDPRIDRLALRAVVFAGEKLDMPDPRAVGRPARIGPGRAGQHVRDHRDDGAHHVSPHHQGGPRAGRRQSDRPPAGRPAHATDRRVR